MHAGWIDPETDGYYEDSSRETPVDYAPPIYFPDADNSIERVKTGIINSGDAGDVYLFSSRNIFKSDRTGPFAGILIAGRIIGEKMLNKLTSMMQYPIGLSRDITHDFVARRTGSGEPYLLSKKDDKNDRIWHVAVPQHNYQGETSSYLFFDHRIGIIDQGIRMVVLINAIILFTFLLLLGIQQVWLMRTVIIPITALNDYIEEQNSIFGEDFILDSGLENEIGRLSRSFHFLFNKLYEKNRQLFFQAIKW